MKTLIVVPARLGSTRLPRKMLLRDTGKTMIEHTYRAASQSRLASEVIVATDDQEILEVVLAFGGRAIMTSPHHLSGTDRVAEIAQQFPEFDLVTNVQGDEPEIAAAAIDAAIDKLQTSNAQVSTVATPLRERELLDDPACVKVVLDHTGRALYFSRSAIPHPRNWDDAWLDEPQSRFLMHMGLYVYRREFLLKFSELPPSPAEQAESLEQLRVLQAGFDIQVAITPHGSRGIDTPDDYRAFVNRQQTC